MIRIHSLGTMNIHTRFLGSLSNSVPLLVWTKALARRMVQLIPFSFSFLLVGQRDRRKKQHPSDFPEDIPHVTLRQIKWPCPRHWRKAGRQGLYACEALLNLAVSEQITRRFQIIVRPVPALVIGHAVLSEARAAGEVVRQWCDMRFSCSLAVVRLLLSACRLIGCGIVSAWVMHSTLCKKDHCYSCL